ncbi:MAG: DNA methyltransferase, partial [bacterium]
LHERTHEDGSDLGPQLAALFQVLNTAPAQRSRALDEQLAAFPHVNGKLFEEPLPLASFTRAMRETLLDCCRFVWSGISPALFGALFQRIMDERARRNLGAHYTSEENILKLIKPLFLDALWEEFGRLRGNRNRLLEFHKKLRALRFLDPACGCGNFLVIAYRELRKLELEVLRASRALADTRTQHLFDANLHQQIAIDVDQFYGIEIEEFPAQIAQVALWLIDHQMNVRIGEEFGLYFARIPLKSAPHIVCGNALTLDWNEVLPAEQCSYVLGNPPFVGKKEQSPQQKRDLEPWLAALPGSGVLDYVSGWYVKAARYMRRESAAAGALLPPPRAGEG